MVFWVHPHNTKYSVKFLETGLGLRVWVKGCHSVRFTHSSSSRRRGPWCRTASSSSCQACWGPAGTELRGAGRQHASGRPGRSPPRRGPARSRCSWTRRGGVGGGEEAGERVGRRWKLCERGGDRGATHTGNMTCAVKEIYLNAMLLFIYLFIYKNTSDITYKNIAK